MSFANFPYLSPIPASFCFDDTVVVLGVGPFGMCFLMKARMLGSGTIIAVDLSDFRLNFAQRLGANYIINRSAAGSPGSHGKPAAYGPEPTPDASLYEALSAARIRDAPLCSARCGSRGEKVDGARIHEGGARTMALAASANLWKLQVT